MDDGVGCNCSPREGRHCRHVDETDKVDCGLKQANAMVETEMKKYEGKIQCPKSHRGSLLFVWGFSMPCGITLASTTKLSKNGFNRGMNEQKLDNSFG